MTIRFGSVCSGIEAASVAWHPLGWRAAWLSEIEPFPCAVLKHHYADVPNHGDMTQLPDRILSGEVEAPDVFCGGTPCQAFSVAGLRKSLDDARGNLSLTFCEIANAIDHVRSARGERPAVIFWENVPGVLSTKDNAFGCFLAGLAGEDGELQPPGGKWANAGCVYGPQRAVAWRVLDAQYFGVAQRRRRVFVVASARAGFDPAAILFEFDGVRRDIAPSRETREVFATGAASSAGGGGLGTDCDGGIIGPLTAACGPNGHGGSGLATDKGAEAGHILPVAFGGNRTSGPIEVTPALLAQPGSGWKGDFESETFLVQPTHTLRGEGFDASEDGTGRGTPLVPVHVPDVAGTMKACKDSSGWSNSADHAAAGYMVPVAFHPTQDPISSTDGTTHAMGCGSKGGQASVAVAVAFSSKDYGADATNDLAPTLRAMNHADSHANGGGQMAVAHIVNGNSTPETATEMAFPLRADDGSGNRQALQHGMQVRRLTPVECERLQGFPDGYTAIPWRKKPASECPDGPRYKALGNSWAVPVVRWIGRRINNAVFAAGDKALEDAA